jgi:hypothetical protein
MEDLSWYTGAKQGKEGKSRVQRKRHSSPQIIDDSDGDADYVYVAATIDMCAFNNQSQPLITSSSPARFASAIATADMELISGSLFFENIPFANRTT